MDEKPLVELMGALDVSDKEALSAGVQEIMDLRVAIEQKICKAINDGLEDELSTEGHISAETCKEVVINISKMTSVSDMNKIIRLANDESTDNTTLTVEEKDTAMDIVRQVLNRG